MIFMSLIAMRSSFLESDNIIASKSRLKGMSRTAK